MTGASSGIGLEIARLLGKEGHAVTLAARRPEKLDAAAAQLADEGLDVQAVAGNLGLEEDVQRVVAAHRERYGRLDVLVNNAGVGIGEAVGELHDEEGRPPARTRTCARRSCSTASAASCSAPPGPSTATRSS